MRKRAVDLAFSEPQEKFPALLAALLAALPAAQRTSRFGDFMRCLKIHEISEKLGAQGASKFFMNLFMSFDMHCLALRHLTRSKLPWRYVTICHDMSQCSMDIVHGSVLTLCTSKRLGS